MEIKFQKVSKAFGDKQLLENFSYTFSVERCTALMGPSGVGKTTLLRLMTGLAKPVKGKIEGIFQNYSMLFQENRLLPFKTALQNVALVSDEKTAKQYLDLLSLKGEYESYPKELSGGMQRRVALARALAFPSDLLILDEPLKGLDEDLRQKVLEILEAESLKRPILWVTHDRREVEFLGASVYEITEAPIINASIRHIL